MAGGGLHSARCRGYGPRSHRLLLMWLRSLPGENARRARCPTRDGTPSCIRPRGAQGATIMGMGGAYSRPASSPWLKHQAAVHVVTARPVTTWMVRGGETAVFWRCRGERQRAPGLHCGAGTAAVASALEPREPPCASGRAPRAVAARSAAARTATLTMAAHLRVRQGRWWPGSGPPHVLVGQLPSALDAHVGWPQITARL